MAERTTGWRSIFSVPAVYRLAQRAIGSPRVRTVLIDEYLRPSPGSRVLDIGCGAGDLAPFLAGSAYVGFDHSEAYVEAARRKYGTDFEFRVGSVGEALDVGSFTHAVAKGVVHHLDDSDAAALFNQACDALEPGGRLATIDPCLTDPQSSFARFLVTQDRGQNVRRPEDYLALAAAHFDDVCLTVRTDLLRLPYSHAVLVCIKKSGPRR